MAANDKYGFIVSDERIDKAREYIEATIEEEGWDIEEKPEGLIYDLTRTYLEMVFDERDVITADDFHVLFYIWVAEGRTRHDTKLSKIDELAQLNKKPKNELLELCSEGNFGWFGTGRFSFYEYLSEKVLGELSTIYRDLLNENNTDRIKKRIDNFGSKEYKGLQSGLLSPVFHLLRPLEYPPVNGAIEGKYKQWISDDFSTDIADYTRISKRMTEFRDTLGMFKDFRELDRVLSNWEDDEFSNTIKVILDADNEIATINNDSITVWKVAPGEKAFDWEYSQDNNLIRCYWPSGDLTNVFEDEDKLNWLEKQWQRQLYNFRHIKEGDIIVANKGRSHIIGVGIVTGDYFFEERYVPYPGEEGILDTHNFPVNWVCVGDWTIENQGAWQRTVLKLEPDVYDEIFRITGFQKETKVKNDNTDYISNILKTKRQIILSGPPGTSKTWLAKRLVNRFRRDRKQEKQDKKLWWIVANPERWSWINNYDWDEGVEDFFGKQMPSNFSNARVGDLFLAYETAPTQEIIAIGQILSEAVKGDDNIWYFDVELLHQFDVGISYHEIKRDSIMEKSQPINRQCQGTLFKLENDEVDRIADLLTEANPDDKELKEILDRLNGDKSIQRSDNPKNYELIQFHPSYTYEDFVRGLVAIPTDNGVTFEPQDKIFAQMCVRAAANSDKTFVLIIDEINRADISKVFGELIYGLEYRGKVVATPYEVDGSTSLTIPPNLYIIGTMNTADKSIAMLDYALRRRFAFIPMYPERGIISGYYNADYGKTRQAALNLFEKVAGCFDNDTGRDLQVGHTYFMVGEKNEGGEITTPGDAGKLEPIEDSDGLELLRLKFIYETAPIIHEYVLAGEDGLIKDKTKPIENAYRSPDIVKELGVLFDAWMRGKDVEEDEPETPDEINEEDEE